jgi:hypothetical protein
MPRQAGTGRPETRPSHSKQSAKRNAPRCPARAVSLPETRGFYPVRNLSSRGRLRPAKLCPVFFAACVAGCAMPGPTAPTVMALPAKGESFALFQQHDATCHAYAAAQARGTFAWAGGRQERYCRRGAGNRTWSRCGCAAGLCFRPRRRWRRDRRRNRVACRQPAGRCFGAARGGRHPGSVQQGLHAVHGCQWRTCRAAGAAADPGRVCAAASAGRLCGAKSGLCRAATASPAAAIMIRRACHATGCPIREPISEVRLGGCATDQLPARATARIDDRNPVSTGGTAGAL